MSKCYKIIDRFSEDVDLVLKYKAIQLEENLDDLSKTAQRKLNQEIIDKTRTFLKDELVTELNNDFKKICFYDYLFKYDINEPDSILFYFPTNNNDNYILPYIKLEIGILAANFPVEDKIITSIVYDYNKELELNDALIPVISIVRTFWEKITIIHAECKREPSKYHRRYSRHFYDVYKILSLVKWDELVKDKNLINEVVRFKEKYYTQNNAKYDVEYILVDERNTTKTCFNCKDEKKKAPDIRLYHCPKCNKTYNRDLNSAINIGIKAQKLSSSDYEEIDLAKASYTASYHLKNQMINYWN